MADEKNDTEREIPDHVIDSLARCLLPHIQNYFESEEGQRFLRNGTQGKRNHRQKGIKKKIKNII